MDIMQLHMTATSVMESTTAFTVSQTLSHLITSVTMVSPISDTAHTTGSTKRAVTVVTPPQQKLLQQLLPQQAINITLPQLKSQLTTSVRAIMMGFTVFQITQVLITAVHMV
ncbi:uncharacterized protein V6R79_016483 [Siganus canaliculatus]